MKIKRRWYKMAEKYVAITIAGQGRFYAQENTAKNGNERAPDFKSEDGEVAVWLNESSE